MCAYRLMPSRAAAIIAADFVMTVLAIQIAMLFPFWQDCAVAFFTLYAFKEACIAGLFIGQIARLPYCISGVLQLLCALEVSFSFEFYAYANYETAMVLVCLAKIASVVNLKITERIGFYELRQL